MTGPKIGMDDLITHRFRGFAPFENTVAGLEGALDFGVRHLEFDIRVAACGTPMIYHDEAAADGNGKTRYLCEIMARDYAEAGGAFARMPTAEALFHAAARHTNTARLLIDIKDAGFGEAIHALVMQHRLKSRVTYVSWLPEALYEIHDIAPDMPLCLSHWCASPDPSIRGRHIVFEAEGGQIPRPARVHVHGERSGWFVNGPVQGDMRDMLIRTGGHVCVPQNMVTADLVADYHRDGLNISAFSYVDLGRIRSIRESQGIDLFFVDDRRVFDALAAA